MSLVSKFLQLNGFCFSGDDNVFFAGLYCMYLAIIILSIILSLMVNISRSGSGRGPQRVEDLSLRSVYFLCCVAGDDEQWLFVCFGIRSSDVMTGL